LRDLWIRIAQQPHLVQAKWTDEIIKEMLGALQYGFEDLQLYREFATNPERRSLPEAGADEPIRSLATGVLRRWAENLPEPVIPKY
jgi:hypothetical protein